jgi:hypothetical protein
MNFNLIKKQIINRRIFPRFLIAIVISVLFISLNIEISSAAGGIRIFGQGMIDSNSSTTIDVNNRQLLYPNGTSALDWSNDGVVLINASTTEATTTALQIKSFSGQDFINLFNDSGNILTIKADGQIVSTLSGTKPLDITSTTLVDNLNADLFDGNGTTTALVLNNQGVKYTINGTGLTIPTLVGQSGKVLTNNASTLSWGTALTAEADTLASVTARGTNSTNFTFTITTGQLNIIDGYNIILGSTYGNLLGYAANQKLAFYGATPIVQPANTLALDTVLTNLGLRASGGIPSVSTNFKIGAGAAGTDYTLTFDGETTDGVITWMEDEDWFSFNKTLSTAGGIIGKVTTVTDTYNVLVSDETIVGNKGTAFTITLPTASAGVIGQIFTIKNIGAGVITIEGAGSDTINGALNKTMNQWSARLFQCISANTWFMLSTYN